MPDVQRPATLAKVYEAARKKIEAGDVPTLMVTAPQALYRWIDPSKLPRPKTGTPVLKVQANRLLVPSGNPQNRFSGPSGDPPNPGIPAASGLYCVLQQQALVNEASHYTRKAQVWALAGQCVLRIRIRGMIMVADLSPHNPGAMRFLRELGPKTWDEMTDTKDCSVARGIGLAIAQSSYLHGLSVETVRESARSAEERGDNMVLYGSAMHNLDVDQAWYFGKTSQPEVYPVV